MLMGCSLTSLSEVFSIISQLSFLPFSCRYRQKVVYLQRQLAKKLADRGELWSIYQLVSLQKSMVCLSVRLEITVLRGRSKELS